MTNTMLLLAQIAHLRDRMGKKIMEENISLDCNIMKYMDLYKFMYMIENQSIYFTRVDKFTDKNEGHFPRKIYEIAKSITVFNPDGESSNKGILNRVNEMK